MKNNFSVPIMKDIFQSKAVIYDLRSQIDFTWPNANSEHFTINSVRYMDMKVWNVVTNNIKM